jgi:hypothetical protein
MFKVRMGTCVMKLISKHFSLYHTFEPHVLLNDFLHSLSPTHVSIAENTKPGGHIQGLFPDLN